jgi:hypothetical protein
MPAKEVKSDLKDVQPSKRGAEFPSDREKIKGERKGRRADAPGARAQRVPRATTQGSNERRGGRDRTERKRHGSIAQRARRRRAVETPGE